jgi:DNA-binding NarL/FixJ family response regulator
MVAGYATTINETLEKAKPDFFDLFILDLHLPGHLPIENIRKLKESFPDKPVVIYTSEASTSWKIRMMDEGAATYIMKNASREELKLSIEKASRGEISYYKEKESKEADDITPMQYEVITLLGEGLIHKEIAEKLGISKSMIEKLLKELRNSFDAKNNIELAKFLTQIGIIK